MNEYLEGFVTVLVPAAGHGVVEYPWSPQRHDPAFLNVGTKLAIERIISFYSNKPNVKTLLAVNDPNQAIFRLNPYESTSQVKVGITSSVGETVLRSLVHVETEWCLINPITTIPTSHLSTEGAIYFGQDQLPKENWSSITLSDVDTPLFHEKSSEATKGILSHPFTGRIYAQTHAIKQVLLELNPNQLNDLLFLAEGLFRSGLARIRYERWLDAGHAATYPDSKLVSISSRYFNSLHYEASTNSITKVSADKEKLRLEGKFYSSSPPSIRRYFPVVINSADVGEKWELEMEYIGYPSLAEIFLYSGTGISGWKRIMHNLRVAYDAFYGSDAAVVDESKWLYSVKTSQRQLQLESLLSENPCHPLAPVYWNSFKLNGRSHPSLESIFEINRRNLLSLEGKRPLHVGHGDMCFNNILVDPIFGSLKLIDPRAQVHNESDICGLIDPLYDLAKLNHSFSGLYDAVVNNLYCLQFHDEASVDLQIFAPPDYHLLLRLFQDMIMLEKSDQSLCNIATVNLFLSMLPLHKDDPQRMLALALVGSTFLLEGSVNSLLLSE
jgi:hypothetical protein